jgi:hypothetical protein
VPLAGGLERLQAVVGDVVREDLLRELAQRVLVLGEVEVHRIT